MPVTKRDGVEALTVFAPQDVAEALRDIAFAEGCTLNSLLVEGLREKASRMNADRAQKAGAAYPQRRGPLRRGRPPKARIRPGGAIGTS